MADEVQEGAVQENQDFESMEPEQLEKFLDGQEAAPQAEATKPEATETEPAEEKEPDVRELAKMVKNLTRESGKWRNFESTTQKLPSQIEQMIKKALEERSKVDSQTPEQRQEEQVRAAQEKALAEFTRKEAIEAIKGQFGDYISFLDKAKQKEQDAQFFERVAEKAGEQNEVLAPIYAELFKKNAKELDSEDEEVVARALEWNKDATSNPSFLVLEAMRHQSKQVTDKAKAFQNGKAQAAKEAGQTVKDGGSKTNSRKAIEEMSQQELDSMETDELEKALAAAGR